MIVVTGPAGNTGKQVVDGLLRRKVPFRAMVRSEARQRELEARNIPVVRGDFRDAGSLRAALEGAEKAYLVCTPDERLVDCEVRFIEIAKASGVKHVVKCSAHSASHEIESPNLRMHAVIEDALRSSGMTYTILRPHGFMQTFFWMSAPLVFEQGILAYPAGDGAIPLIDVRDVGPAAIRALLEPGFEGTYDFTGPEPLTGAQMAATLSTALGKTITYADMPEEALDEVMRQVGVPDAPRNHVLWCFRAQKAGKLAQTSNGHVPFGITLRTFADFASDLAAGRTGTATSDFSR